MTLKNRSQMHIKTLYIYFKLLTIQMKRYQHLALIFTLLTCNQLTAQINETKWNITEPNGHWKHVETELVHEVPFLNLHTKQDELKIASEASPWDYYTPYDLVFEKDTLYKLNYPEQVFESVKFFIDTGYIHFTSKDLLYSYPAEVGKDTLHFYIPLLKESVFFKETFTRSAFNDSILKVIKKYGINYPSLVGTWVLIREKDYAYGTHYELKFPHIIPDSIVLNRAQMITALDQPKVLKMKTDGIERDYSFWYNESHIYLKPGDWYKEEEDPMIHFYKK